MALAQNVECSLGESDKLGLSGRVKMANGRGDGAFVATWRRAASWFSLFECDMGRENGEELLLESCDHCAAFTAVLPVAFGHRAGMFFQ
ncbi:unnamed protein product [Anisakis simplex]|uniref:Uncharacterized protein n=1 Tax=Anisakis simplex TaxID=6269 RepID=A0A0M3JMC5_ANISI|nr:unnamed protein product [Anisakis simplex]